jgi:hypothetical protein
MSAFIVDKEHIDRIVSAASAANKLPRPGSENEIGRMLWRENLISVAARYPGDGDGDRPGPSDFKDSDVDTYVWTPTDIITGNALRKTLACLRYQSCEHDGWPTSAACAFIERLMPAEDMSARGKQLEEATPWGGP